MSEKVVLSDYVTASATDQVTATVVEQRESPAVEPRTTLGGTPPRRPKPVKAWQVIVGLAIAAIVATVAILGFNAIKADQAAHAEAVKQAEVAAAQQAEHDALAIKFAAPIQAELVKTPPPPPVVEAPPTDEGEGGGGYVAGQSGDLVPFIGSGDPNNAAGGDYIDPGLYCLNGSASGNPPVCD